MMKIVAFGLTLIACIILTGVISFRMGQDKGKEEMKATALAMYADGVYDGRKGAYYEFHKDLPAERAYFLKERVNVDFEGVQQAWQKMEKNSPWYNRFDTKFNSPREEDWRTVDTRKNQGGHAPKERVENKSGLEQPVAPATSP